MRVTSRDQKLRKHCLAFVLCRVNFKKKGAKEVCELPGHVCDYVRCWHVITSMPSAILNVKRTTFGFSSILSKNYTELMRI